MLACDKYGQLYSVAPDKSYHPIEWEDLPYPPNMRVVRVNGKWTVDDGFGVGIALFPTRQDARNFIKYANQTQISRLANYFSKQLSGSFDPL